MTLASGLLPGVGYLYSRRTILGSFVLVPTLIAAGVAYAMAPHDLHGGLDLAFDPGRLQAVAWLVVAVLVAWLLVLVTTFLMVRPTQVSAWKTSAGGVAVVFLCLAVAAPVGLVVRDAFVQVDLVNTIFKDNESATIPDHVTAEDPWGGRSRVNILLLGGDAGPGRDGTRTDSMILVSMDTSTGKTVTFSLPRNMMDAQFPKSSPLHAAYPNGFTGEGDDGNWMLNAIYREVPILHPHILGKSHNEGADAIKLAIQGSTGLRVDYYLLVDLAGFRRLIDAMGGVTVNINEPVAIGGSTDAGRPPEGYLEPGPHQHLDGYQALWFSRGRYGSDDYQRMERQRCMINAIIDEADPITLLSRYKALAEAGKDILQTDIPHTLIPAFVDLALKSKQHRVKSVVFRSSDEFYPGDPDFDYLRSTVQAALHGKHHGSSHKPGGGVDDDKDVCGYHPLA
jgi:LCP family protein required for cell wall assembly